MRLELAEGTTLREAEQLADEMNARVHALPYVGEDPTRRRMSGAILRDMFPYRTGSR